MRKIFAHAHELRLGDVCAGPRPRKMKKNFENFFFRKVEK